MATSSRSRRDFLKWLGAVGTVGAIGAVSQVYATLDGSVEAAPASPIEYLLPCYFQDARNNVVVKNERRAMLSSHIYPKATFVRDAFYGPLALNDVVLSAECYRWFAETQNQATGQIRTAVPFLAVNEPLFPPWDDDSSVLFLIWSAWLRRYYPQLDTGPIEKAWDFTKAHVQNDFFVSPAAPFCYWADTVQFEVPERVTHNHGLYVVALRAMLDYGWGGVTSANYDRARARYSEFYRSDLGTLVLGKDSWWANQLDISVLFPEFMLRWLYNEAALPDAIVRSTADRFLQVARVDQADKFIAGIKVICAADGSFLPSERFAVPALNGPGNYQNGGYWPMYTLTALALRYKIAPDPSLKKMIEDLIKVELARDRRSKEIIILAPASPGAIDPNRSGYTWNSLIVPALKWAGVA